MTGGKQPRIFYGYIVVAASFLVIAMMWGAAYCFGVFFEPLLAEFGWTRATTSGAYALCMIFTGVLSLVAGRLTDKIGPRLVITGCGLFLGTGYILMSQINAVWQLYLFYGVIVGIGMGGSFVPTATTVMRWFVKRRGVMAGVTASGVGMGTLIMPPIANWLISAYGWRISYIVVGSVAIVLITLVAQLLKRDPSQIGCVPYGESELEENRYVQSTGFSLQQALHTRLFWMFSIALVCFGLNLGTVMVHIVSHAIRLGLSAASATGILSVIGGISIGGRVIMGSASDRIGNRITLLISFGLISVALFWLLAARELWMFYMFAVLFGFGYGGMAALGTPVVAELFGLSSLGAIMGVTMICVEGAGAVGPVVAGHIFDITGSYNLAFTIYAVANLIGLVLVVRLKSARGYSHR
ncbi:MFS transporter [Chloroflexota bacterium]